LAGYPKGFQSRDFLDFLKESDVFDIAESWTGLEKYEISGY
jgi:hypothetical protein